VRQHARCQHPQQGAEAQPLPRQVRPTTLPENGRRRLGAHRRSGRSDHPRVDVCDGDGRPQPPEVARLPKRPASENQYRLPPRTARVKKGGLHKSREVPSRRVTTAFERGRGHQKLSDAMTSFSLPKHGKGYLFHNFCYTYCAT